jgi:hypothetical protein
MNTAKRSQLFTLKNCIAPNKWENDLTKLNSLNIHSVENDNPFAIVKDLKECLCIQRERIWFELDQEWDRLIKIQTTNSYNKDHEKNTYYSISINSLANQDWLEKITLFSNLRLNPMSVLTTNFSFVFLNKLHKFAMSFLEICRHSIQNDCQIETVSKNDSSIIEITLTDCNSNSNQSKMTVLESKLDKLILLLNILYDILFKYDVWIYSSDGIHQKVKLMNIFFICCHNDFFKIVYEQLLTSIIPTKNLDADLECEINKTLSKFENNLTQIEFCSTLSNDASTRNQFAVLEELFIRKKCTFINETARSMMKDNNLIFETSIVELNSKDSVDNLIQELNKCNINIQTNDMSKDLELIIKSANSLHVSKLAKDLFKLIYETMNDAYNILIDEKQSIKNVFLLCLISRNLFELFINVVPNYHESNLKTLPILPMILYNDFSYLAVNCLLLSHHYKKMIESNEFVGSINKCCDKIDIYNSFCCFDLVLKLMSTGQSIIVKEIEKQQCNMCEFFNENSSGLKDLSETNTNNYELFLSSLKKCLYQIKSLSSIWKSISTHESYLRVFGLLFEAICQNLIKSCIDLEDISSDDASYLHSSFLYLMQAINDFFSNSFVKTESNGVCSIDLIVNKYIRSWQKFKYLITILKGNFLDLEALSN